MKKIISILTATRAEYGLLKPIILKLNQLEEIEVKIVVTGMHLLPEFGFTYKEIEKDNLVIDKKIDILDSSDSPAAISKAMGQAMIKFADYFEVLNPDLLVVLGDRYETLAVSCVAMNARVPIAHLYGGETTEGAVDESIRHAITKMSYLHFTSTEEYRKRIIQLGESPKRVFNVGAIGIENIKNINILSKKQLEESINFSLDKPFAIITFHPVTLEENTAAKQFSELLMALDKFSEYSFVFTKANADANGRIINRMIDQYVSANDNTIGFESLGTIRYLSAMNYCDMVIGNSSSGLIEAPSFGIPTVNIGDRQKGRLQSSSIINCVAEEKEIVDAIRTAGSKEFMNIAKMTINPYGDGKNTSDKIVQIIEKHLKSNNINLKKIFYDIEFEVNHG